MYSKPQGVILSGFLAVFFLGCFSGKQNNFVPGLFPYFANIAQWESNRFQEKHETRIAISRLKEEKDRATILKILSRFHTGLSQEQTEQIPGWIISESKKYNFDPLFLTAVIITESSFFNWALSNRGAMGLMQIRMNTGSFLAKEKNMVWKGKATLYDPQINIRLGAYYLDKLIKRFGDPDLALEAYNRGPTKLARYLKRGYRPINYSNKVIGHLRKIRTGLG